MSHTPLLDTINSPTDLKKLSVEQLETLAAEIRETIIQTVSQTGGHLAPCLGVVELTLAIHYVFDTPEDKLVWDVGHQSYAHKLITGRRKQFHTLRQYQGISGFPKRAESPFDAFDTGHSSTSISASLGIATGKDLKGDPHKSIAVIGDGSMTGGMAFEALNQAGHLHKNLIVILNDNEMSISPNVGALSSFLSRKLTSKTAVRVKKEMEHFLKSFSHVGENILSVLKKSEESFKGFFTPGMLFEALKFEYIGPIPGHKLENLIEALSNVRDFSTGPTLIHVLTTKGKGYEPAEKNPGDFHGVGPFCIETGLPIPSPPAPPSYTKVFGETLVRIAEQDALEEQYEKEKEQYDNELDQYNREIETDIASGACMLIRSGVFKKTGYINDEYFLYWEDADFSEKVKRAGFKVIYYPKTWMWHKVSASTGGSGSPTNDYFLIRNRFYFALRYMLPRTKFAVIRDTIKQIFTGRKWQKWGAIDALLGRKYMGQWKYR